jgi:hypothetical protein
VASNRSNGLSWAIDTECVKVAWFAAGAPLTWFPDETRGLALADEETLDADTEFLRAQTMRKLQEFEPKSVSDLRSAVVTAHSALLEWLAANPLNWAGTVKPMSVLNDVDRCIHEDNKIGATRALRKVFPDTSSPLAGVKSAVEARVRKLKPKRQASWKLAILDALREANACAPALSEASDVFNEIDDLIPFDKIALTEGAKGMIHGYDNWLTARHSIIKLFPPLWRDYHYRA